MVGGKKMNVAINLSTVWADDLAWVSKPKVSSQPNSTACSMRVEREKMRSCALG